MSAIPIVFDERYQMLPPMPPEQFDALKADIAERGVLVPIDITEDGYILDGHHRYRACLELGITDFPTIVRPGMDESERRAFARQNNVLRRHLTRAQVRELIRQQLRETPDWANNRIGQVLGVDKKTVQAQRKRMEATGEIPKLTELIGADGKQRKAKRPVAVMAPNAGELQKILKQLQEGIEDAEGFWSAQGLVVIGIAADPFAELNDDERREWLVFLLEGLGSPDYMSWIRRRDFRSPTEFYGPEGQAFMTRIGLPPKRKDLAGWWSRRLAKYDGKTLSDLDAMLAEARQRARRGRAAA